MQVVNNEMVPMAVASMLLQMRMIRRQFGMRMVKHGGVFAGSEPQGKPDAQNAQGR